MPTIRAGAGLVAVVALFAITACSRGQRDFAQIPTGPTPGGVYTTASCSREVQFPEPAEGANSEGVPYPTPVGARVKPGITGIPLPPGAVEVDGFELSSVPFASRSTRSTVQVFDVPLSEDEVLSFFDDALRSRHWIVRGHGGGPNGIQCTFVPSTLTRMTEAQDWIFLSTAYIPREEDEEVQPPPGFRGKGIRFAPANPGLTRFWLVTPK